MGGVLPAGGFARRAPFGLVAAGRGSSPGERAAACQDGAPARMLSLRPVQEVTRGFTLDEKPA